MYLRTLTAPRCSGRAVLLFAALTAQILGWSHESIPQDRETAAARFVAQRLQAWQERMNLKGWKIQVDLVRADRLEPKTLGNIPWDTDVKAATIFVLSPKDYKLPNKAMLEDMEF